MSVVRHRRAFVDEDTDEAARLCQRQRVTQQLHRLSFSPCAWSATAWSTITLSRSSCPTLGLHLLAQRLQHRQRGGRVALGQVDPGLAEGEFVRLGQLRGCRQIALAKQRQHLRGGNFGDAQTQSFAGARTDWPAPA